MIRFPTTIHPLAAALFILQGLPVAAAPERLLDAFISDAWTVSDGLSESNVRNVMMASDGYLWITSPKDLRRFDGVSFEKIPPPPGFDPATSPLVAASFAADGALWLHGFRKVWRYHQGRWQSMADALFATTTDPNDDVVRILHQADGSTWWLLRRGPVLWRSGQSLRSWLEPGPLPTEKWFSDIAIDQAGSILVARWNGLYRIDGDTLMPMPAEALHDGRPFGWRLANRRSGGIWLYAPCGLSIIDGSRIDLVAPFANAPQAEVIAEAADGAVWVVGDAGIHRWHGGDWSFCQPGHLPVVTRFTTIESSANGDLWLAGDGGLVNLQPRGYRRLELPDGQRLHHQSPSAAWSNGRGEVLLGMQDHIFRMTHEGSEVRLLETLPGASQPGSAVISVITKDADETLWVGTGNEQLWYLKNGSWKHSFPDPASPVPAAGITAILPWPGQPPFFGSVNGLMRLTPQDTLLPAHPSLPLDRVRCLVRDPGHGGIWIGYESSGLVYYDPAQNQVAARNTPAGLPAGPVNSVLATRDGTLWLSVGSSIVRWQGGKIAYTFNRRHGLPPAEIGLLADDGEGGLWLANDGTLACIRYDDFAAVETGRLQTLRVRHHGRGLPAKTLFYPVAGEPWRDPGARFAIAGGLIESRASFLPAAMRRPVLRLKTISSRDLVLAKLDPPFPGMHAPGPVHVPPGKNPIDIAFTAIHAGPPDLQQFRFRIKGIDDDWTDLGNARSLDIPFLPPGQHQIELAIRDSNGEWIESDGKAILQVGAFFWQTRWFLFLTWLAGSVIIFALTRWLLRRRYHQRRQQEELIHRERSRIARDIHDDLGAGLTHLAMVARIAENDAREGSGEALAGHLNEVFTEASAMVRSVDEIVWAVTPANDHLGSVVDYIVQYAQHYLRAAKLTCRIDLPDTIPSLPVRASIRHHIYMAVQESLNNIVKHASATQAHLSIALAGRQLHITIADDGCGFDPAEIPPDHEPGGLQNFAKRMAQAGGRFVLDTAPGMGTRVLFEIPMEIRNSSPARA